ncbi:MAG: CoA transferase subunit A [Planctomycetes bacterium]|nr:CoA transferase subunit A [Planctomycetota bacterium]
MLDRVTTVENAVRQYVQSAQTIMVGGFGRGGVPFTTVKFIADHANEYRNLTLIKNDANEPGIGIDALFRQGQVNRLIATHIGLNPEFIRRMNDGEVECELIPQGIFAEKIRAGGAGIPAILTDIGLGTEVEAGKRKFELNGRTLLVEEALRGDVALIRADRADRAGNAWWRGSNRNMCVVMGTACKRVIVEANEIVDVGTLTPENIHLPSVFVDAVVPAGPLPHGDANAA